MSDEKPVSGESPQIEKTAPSVEERKTVEQLAKEQQTPAWLFGAAKVKHKWPLGKQITAAEFTAAMAATRKHTATGK